MKPSKLASALAFASALASALAASSLAAAAPHVWIADDGARVRRDDTASPLSRGEGNPIWQPGSFVRLGALREEVIAFQVIVEALDGPLGAVTIDLDLAPPGGGSAEALVIDRFVEHYVEVSKRSRNTRRPAESLGWAPRARPPDDRMLGALPDALVPVELAAPWCPYPLRVSPGRTGALWIDVTVPRTAAPGVWRGAVRVRDATKGPLARIPIEIVVSSAVLPYRPVSFIAYYGRGELAERIGDADRAERSLFQLLHRHHVDALASLRERGDVARLSAALDGSLYTQAWGYVGPGEGRAPGAVALGAYGYFDPTPASLREVEAIVPAIPLAVEDVFLYAMDEDCESSAGPTWRRLARSSRAMGRVRIAHTCNRDPRGQDVDLVLVPAEAMHTRSALGARASGKGVWVYNGSLPRAGTLLLDADVTSLRADGWIAASHDVERWFLWETTFWNDDNRGGHGPVDPFTTAESFHNKQGDAALGDGVLVYPGTQRDRFKDRSLGFTGVIPSMRLKNLRRGIQDAGYVALARGAHPAETDAVVDALIPAALDEIGPGERTAWPHGGAPFAAAREALRALIPEGASIDAGAARSRLEDAAAARRDRIASATVERWLVRVAAVIGVCAAIVIPIASRRRARRSRIAGPAAAGTLPDPAPSVPGLSSRDR